MPTYEYECKSCGVRFERKQKWHDDPVKECPECQGAVRKVLQPVGIVFKGSGFYKTDNPSSGSRAARAEDESKAAGKTETKTEPKGGAQSAPSGGAKAEAPSEAKSGAKAEEKPAAKTEPKPSTEH